MDLTGDEAKQNVGVEDDDDEEEDSDAEEAEIWKVRFDHFLFSSAFN